MAEPTAAFEGSKASIGQAAFSRLYRIAHADGAVLPDEEVEEPRENAPVSHPTPFARRAAALALAFDLFAIVGGSGNSVRRRPCTRCDRWSRG